MCYPTGQELMVTWSVQGLCLRIGEVVKSGGDEDFVRNLNILSKLVWRDFGITNSDLLHSVQCGQCGKLILHPTTWLKPWPPEGEEDGKDIYASHDEKTTGSWLVKFCPSEHIPTTEGTRTTNRNVREGTQTRQDSPQLCDRMVSDNQFCTRRQAQSARVANSNGTKMKIDLELCGAYTAALTGLVVLVLVLLWA